MTTPYGLLVLRHVCAALGVPSKNELLLVGVILLLAGPVARREMGRRWLQYVITGTGLLYFTIVAMWVI